MKSILTTITLSMAALITTSAMAVPHVDHRDQQHRYEQQRWDHRNDHRWNNNKHYGNTVIPSRHWRSGQYLPSQFGSSRYHVNYKNYRHLSKPGKYQQWYRINGDYVLVNQKNHRIIRVIG